MIKRRIFILGLGLLGVFIMIFSVPCYGQSSATFQLKRWSISNGGGALTSSNFHLKESGIGSSAVGRSASNNYVLNGGMLITTVEDSNLAQSILPELFTLQQNYPNPFNPTTTIEYSLPKGSEVRIKIFNEIGQMVKTIVQGYQPPGNYLLIWNGTNNQDGNVPSGIYFYQIIADGFTDVRNMILLR